MSKTPRTDALQRQINERVSSHAEDICTACDFARVLELELNAEREHRQLVSRVTTDALAARNRAEADRDTARAECARLSRQIDHAASNYSVHP